MKPAWPVWVTFIAGICFLIGGLLSFVNIGKIDQGNFTYKEVLLLDSQLIVNAREYHVRLSTQASSGRLRDYEIKSSNKSFDTLAIQKRLKQYQNRTIRLGLMDDGVSVATIENARGEVVMDASHLKSATIFTGIMMLIVAVISIVCGFLLNWQLNAANPKQP